MSITLAQIVNAVETTLSDATGLTYTQSYDELSEGIADTPLLQVYWESIDQDATAKGDRSTFRAGVRQSEILVHADLYAAPRAHLGENMSDNLDLVDAIIDELEENQTQFFGLSGIQGMHWSARRVTFNYDSAAYVGSRFEIRIYVY